MTDSPNYPCPDRPAVPSPDERTTALTDAGTARPHLPALTVDLDAVAARYRAILTTPDAAFRAALVHSVTDIPALVSEVDRLYALLVLARRRYADLAAAARATLAAESDGERDPLAYLRDELIHADAPGAGSRPGRGRR
jgi:hypothetical protein